MATSLIVTTADYQTGKTQQTTFTGVNPAAKTAELQTFGEMTAALSKDTFVKATRVEQVDCSVTKPQIPITRMDVAPADGTYPTFTVDNPVINLTTSSFIVSTKSILVRIMMPYLGNAPIISYSSDVWSTDFVRYGMAANSGMANNTWSYRIGCTAESIQPQSFVMHIHFDETDDYAAFDLPVTVTITEG